MNVRGDKERLTDVVHTSVELHDAASRSQRVQGILNVHVICCRALCMSDDGCKEHDQRKGCLSHEFSFATSSLVSFPAASHRHGVRILLSVNLIVVQKADHKMTLLDHGRIVR
jgi:hypothetical protein